MKTIIVIDDEKDIRNLLKKILELEGYTILLSENAGQAIKLIEKHDIAVALVDIRLPDMNGIELTRLIKEKQPETEVICFTAYGNVPDGVMAIKNGAFDYLMKGDDNNKIIPVVARAFEKSFLQRRIKRLEENLKKKYGFDNIIGNSESLLKAVELAKKVAPSNASVLITGETGTGKEIFAHALHTHSPRIHEPFVALNCAAFPKDLLESEIFGHKAGAFTGAVRDKKGLIEEAHKGTLFLDEIGEMDIGLQARLLRVLESGTYLKVGDTKEFQADVRVISATHRNLEKEIETGNFREDLFYRLSGFHIHLPSLNQRMEDIPLLAEQFLKESVIKNNRKVSGFTFQYIQVLQQHNWRGNIRELKNVIERSVILSETEEISVNLLPPEFNKGKNHENENAFTLEEMEIRHIRRMFEKAKGNKTKAAKLLGIGLTTLYRKLEQYGL
ncbi:MAG: sigma-54-dependent Fis family transcriptional regulator [Bacteroidales bacterium]|nr:sigma-54-dependent Fis family transcriptional regulator [Bacteroidales bacterium]